MNSLGCIEDLIRAVDGLSYKLRLYMDRTNRQDKLYAAA